MALSQERMGQIALAVLLHQKREEGIHLRPKEVKREISNGAKRIN